MIDPNVFLGLPVDFRGICKVYPPKVKEVMANPKSTQLFKLLTYSQEDIEDLLQGTQKQTANQGEQTIPTPLEFMLVNSYTNKEFEQLIKEAFQLFIHEDATLIYSSKIILIGDIPDLAQITDVKQFRYLSEENFFDFQNVVRGAFGVDPILPPIEEDNPVVKRVKQAARRRERLSSKNKGKKGISLTTSLGAICCMGIGLTPLNIGEISYASVEVLTTLYQQKEKYQTDIDSLMAGADPKKVHPKYWIRDKSDFNEIKL